MARGKKKESALTPEEKLSQALVPVEEQPYKVPENWCWTKLRYIGTVKGGKRIPKGHQFADEPTEYPYIRVTDFRDGGIAVEGLKYVNKSTFNQIKNYTISSSDIYVSIAGSIGKVGIVPLELDGANLTENAAKITDITGIDQIYLLRFLSSESAQQQMAESTISTTQPKLALFRIEDISLPIPPLAEQQRIVDRIEYLFAKLDEARGKAQSVLDSFETRKAAILHKAFTGELTANWRTEHGVELGNWRQITLSQCSAKIGDGLHGTPSFCDDGEYYFVNGNNFAGQHLEIKPETKRVSVAEYEKYKTPLFKNSTVFVSINGTLGKTAFYNDEPVILGKSACYVHVTDDLNKFFLRYYFETKEFIDYANTMATGSTIKNLGLKAMRNMPICIPDIDEQIEIVRILDSLFAKEQQAKEAAEAVLEKIDLLKKSILARAFRGELGTNNPTEESAVELLKEILQGDT